MQAAKKVEVDIFARRHLAGVIAAVHLHSDHVVILAKGDIVGDIEREMGEGALGLPHQRAVHIHPVHLAAAVELHHYPVALVLRGQGEMAAIPVHCLQALDVRFVQVVRLAGVRQRYLLGGALVIARLLGGLIVALDKQPVGIEIQYLALVLAQGLPSAALRGRGYLRHAPLQGVLVLVARSLLVLRQGGERQAA